MMLCCNNLDGLQQAVTINFRWPYTVTTNKTVFYAACSLCVLSMYLQTFSTT